VQDGTYKRLKLLVLLDGADAVSHASLYTWTALMARLFTPRRLVNMAHGSLHALTELINPLLFLVPLKRPSFNHWICPCALTRAAMAIDVKRGNVDRVSGPYITHCRLPLCPDVGKIHHHPHAHAHAHAHARLVLGHEDT
jgi:hypothetical protein